MLPRNLLVDLLYRYKLVKQAALNNHIKEAYLKQLQYQDQIQKLMDLYRADSLVKKASLLNDLYEQALLTKLAGLGHFRQGLGLFGEGFRDIGRKIIEYLAAAKGKVGEGLGAIRDRLGAGLRTVKDKTQQALSAIGSKAKEYKQGLIGGGAGLTAGLGAGLYGGQSLGYEQGKADALSNLSEEDLKALLSLMKEKK
jgi:hypothetical protein